MKLSPSRSSSFMTLDAYRSSSGRFNFDCRSTTCNHLATPAMILPLGESEDWTLARAPCLHS